MARVLKKARTQMSEQEQLTALLFWYAEQQVTAHREGKLRQAVWYRRSARSVGVNIMQMVRAGTWHTGS